MTNVVQENLDREEERMFRRSLLEKLDRLTETVSGLSIDLSAIERTVEHSACDCSVDTSLIEKKLQELVDILDDRLEVL